MELIEGREQFRFDGRHSRLIEEGISQELVGSVEPSIAYLECKYGKRTASAIRAALERATKKEVE